MSMIGGLLRHSIDVVGDVVSGTLDPDGEDWGHPGVTPTVLGTYRGLIQPKTAREVASTTGTDANVGAFRVYLERAALELPVDTDMRLVKSGDPDPDLDGTYQVTYVGNAAGFGHHAEIVATRLEA